MLAWAGLGALVTSAALITAAPTGPEAGAQTQDSPVATDEPPTSEGTEVFEAPAEPSPDPDAMGREDAAETEPNETEAAENPEPTSQPQGGSVAGSTVDPDDPNLGRAQSDLEGEASVRGREIARVLREAERPLALVAGGECTVTVRGHGTGGRCQELALAAAVELARRSEVALVAAGTDGRDGPTDAAGAVVGGDTVQDVLSAEAALEENDSHGFLDAAGAVIRTGPTGTNVGDLLIAWNGVGRR